jgi:hypothetical protein
MRDSLKYRYLLMGLILLAGGVYQCRKDESDKKIKKLQKDKYKYGKPNPKKKRLPYGDPRK